MKEEIIRNKFGEINKIIFTNSFQTKIEYFNITSIQNWDSQFGGNIKVNNMLISGEFIEPPYISDDNKFVVLAKNNDLNFSIFVVNLKDNQCFESRLKFEMLSIEKMKFKTIFFHKACHCEDIQNRIEIEFNKSNFNFVG